MVHHIRASSNGLTVSLWRGERMCLLGMDVAESAPGVLPPDFVGFAIEVKAPGDADFIALKNRLHFDYAHKPAVDGYRNYSSLEAPFQTFRWIHFPWEPKVGTYFYRVTMMHWAANGLKPGASVTAEISLDPTTYSGFLDVGFTRNFASSQAFEDRFANGRDKIIPARAKDGLTFAKDKAPPGVYDWLGFEAYALLNGFLDWAKSDPTIDVDVLGYDFNEPDLLAKLKAMAGDPGRKVRVVLDDSSTHAGPAAAESIAADELRKAGAEVRRHHFHRFQHNKILIGKPGGKARKVLCGSTNFSFRGFYIQANNMLVFDGTDAATLFSQMFDLAFQDPEALTGHPLTKAWHLVAPTDGPPVHFCFAPHLDFNTSLAPVAGAIDQATSSVLYSVAFLNMDKNGPVRQALDRLIGRPLFSYGIVDNAAGLAVTKPNGETGLVDFAYLAGHAPEPFKSEWSGGGGIHIHHKFIVTDFSLSTAKVFTGSSNLAAGGEHENGDHLIQIADGRVATSYAIEALRTFDHLRFRALMQEKGVPQHANAGTNENVVAAGPAPKALTLWKPGDPGLPWWTPFYTQGSSKAQDRVLFSS